MNTIDLVSSISITTQPVPHSGNAIVRQRGCNGIDILLVDQIKNPTRIMIVEVKGTRNVGNNAKWELGKDIGENNVKQMSDAWVQHVKTYFDDNTDVYKILDKIPRATEFGITVEKLGMFVEGNGVINVLKL
jgi:hypothetical protein